jgi:hypothetical protein
MCKGKNGSKRDCSARMYNLCSEKRPVIRKKADHSQVIGYMTVTSEREIFAHGLVRWLTIQARLANSEKVVRYKFRRRRRAN